MISPIFDQKRQEEIHPSDMKDGELAVMVSWSGPDDPIGSVVQRYRDCLVVLGLHIGLSYPSVCYSQPPKNDRVRVALLNKREILVHKSNA